MLPSVAILAHALLARAASMAGGQETLKSLQRRLGAARVLLGPAAGASHHATLSKSQVAAVVDVERRGSGLSAEDRAGLVEVATSVPWAPGDLEVVIEVLAGKASSFRRKQQDFEAFPSYIDEDRWAVILNPTASVDAKQHAVFDVVIGLGLRLPSERTAKMLSSFMLLVTRPWEDASSLPTSMKICFNRRNKSEFIAYVRSASNPPVHILTLPSAPGEYMAMYETMYRAFYGTAGPAECKIDIMRLKLLDDTYKCRGDGSVTRQAPQAVPTISLGGTTNNNSLEQFGNLMLQAMQGMQQQQGRMMELMMGSSGGQVDRSPRGIRSLVDKLGSATYQPPAAICDAPSTPLPTRADRIGGDTPLGSAGPPSLLQPCRAIVHGAALPLKKPPLPPPKEPVVAGAAAVEDDDDDDDNMPLTLIPPENYACPIRSRGGDEASCHHARHA